MELNVSAGCSTLLAGSRASPLEVRKNARMTQCTAARSCVALRVTELRLNGNEDERHYDVAVDVAVIVAVAVAAVAVAVAAAVACCGVFPQRPMVDPKQ